MHPCTPPPIDALPDLILGMAFYPLEEGGTNLCNVVPHPIVWNLGPPVCTHHFAQNV